MVKDTVEVSFTEDAISNKVILVFKCNDGRIIGKLATALMYECQLLEYVPGSITVESPNYK